MAILAKKEVSVYCLVTSDLSLLIIRNLIRQLLKHLLNWEFSQLNLKRKKSRWWTGLIKCESHFSEYFQWLQSKGSLCFLMFLEGCTLFECFLCFILWLLNFGFHKITQKGGDVHILSRLWTFRTQYCSPLCMVRSCLYLILSLGTLPRAVPPHSVAVCLSQLKHWN